MKTFNNKYVFTFSPNDFTAMTATATAGGLQIKHTDHFYKNEILVTSNGITQGIETPNMPFIYMSIFCVCLLFLVGSLLLDLYLILDTHKKEVGWQNTSLLKRPTAHKNFCNFQKVHYK